MEVQVLSSALDTNEANPGLHELVQELTDAGFRFELRPVGGMDDGTTRQTYYGVYVLLDGLTSAELGQLLAIVEGSPYDGRTSNGRLLLETPRR
ncbi:MAG TPA: hypothetical protein VGK69_01230 [Gaiellaceae bacterium]